MSFPRYFTTLLALLALAFATCAFAQETNAEVEARRVALEMAGAFSNDGFKMRDGHWAGTIAQGQNAVIAVNLYAGNHYWFSTGANQAAKGLSVTIHDEHGKPVEADQFQQEDRAAAGFSPAISGQYFVAIHAGDQSESTYCLVYSYR